MELRTNITKDLVFHDDTVVPDVCSETSEEASLGKPNTEARYRDVLCPECPRERNEANERGEVTGDDQNMRAHGRIGVDELEGVTLVENGTGASEEIILGHRVRFEVERRTGESSESLLFGNICQANTLEGLVICLKGTHADLGVAARLKSEFNLVPIQRHKQRESQELDERLVFEIDVGVSAPSSVLKV